MNRQDLITMGGELSLLFYYSPYRRHRVYAGDWVFSHRYPAEFTVDGQRYRHMQQFMAAEKARLFGDWELRGRILAQEDSDILNRLARRVRHFDHQVWVEYLPEVAVHGNIAKFTAHPRMREYLGTTAGFVLAEASPRDKVGGIGLAAARPEAKVPARWRGANLHGFALMAARDALNG